MPRRPPSRKRVKTVGVLSFLSTPVVARLSFVQVLLLSLFQQTSQRAMLFRISLKMGPLTNTHLAFVPCEYVGSILHVPLWASAQLTALISGDFCNTKRDLIIFHLVKI